MSFVDKNVSFALPAKVLISQHGEKIKPFILQEDISSEECETFLKNTLHADVVRHAYFDIVEDKFKLYAEAEFSNDGTKKVPKWVKKGKILGYGFMFKGDNGKISAFL